MPDAQMAPRAELCAHSRTALALGAPRGLPGGRCRQQAHKAPAAPPSPSAPALHAAATPSGCRATGLRPVIGVGCDRFATGFRRGAGRQAWLLRLSAGGCVPVHGSGTSGEGGIRTLERACAPYSLSRLWTDDLERMVRPVEPWLVLVVEMRTTWSVSRRSVRSTRSMRHRGALTQPTPRRLRSSPRCCCPRSP